MSRWTYPTAVACLMLAGPALHSENWPEFRGPTGQGISRAEHLPTEWGPAKNVAWKKQLPGTGWSSPAVVSGKVYLTAAVKIPGGDDLSLRALCLDARDGKLLWGQEVFKEEAGVAPPIHGKNSHASPTPLVAAGRLYVHFGHMGTACLDLAGKVLWRHREAYQPVHGNGGSPVLVDGRLVFSTDGATERLLVALDAGTGKVRWKTKRSGKAARKNFAFGTPLVITVGGKKQIISQGSNMVGAYDPQTGAEIWRVRYTGYSVIPRPVFGQGLLFIGTGYDRAGLIAVRPGGEGDVTETHVVWSTQKGAPHTPSPLLVGEELYLVSDSGVASCLEAKTGKVHWSKRLRGRGYSASPVAACGRVYFLSEDGVGTVVKAGKTFQEVARNEIGERTLASYAVSDGALFLRTERNLYRIGKAPAPPAGGDKVTKVTR
jgi:outer membrane protein assembly factor BamB